MAYAARWDLDDPVLDREEVEAVIAHVAALAHVAAVVTRGRRGLHATFRFPVAAAVDVVTALDPDGVLLGDEWYRELEPPPLRGLGIEVSDADDPGVDDPEGGDGYIVRLELVGAVDGGSCDDADAGDPDADAPRRRGDPARCEARLRVDAFDNREAWPIAFALAHAIVERLGGELRETPSAADRDDGDDELDWFEHQRRIPPLVIRTGVATIDAAGGTSAGARHAILIEEVAGDAGATRHGAGGGGDGGDDRVVYRAEHADDAFDDDDFDDDGDEDDDFDEDDDLDDDDFDDELDDDDRDAGAAGDDDGDGDGATARTGDDDDPWLN